MIWVAVAIWVCWLISTIATIVLIHKREKAWQKRLYDEYQGRLAAEMYVTKMQNALDDLGMGRRVRAYMREHQS